MVSGVSLVRWIPINKPTLDASEEREVLEVLRSGILTSPAPEGGPKVREFERLFSRFIGVKYAIAVNSGTAALYASLLALDLKPGDEVIVPSFTFIATANVVLLLGAKPVFADIDLDTYNIDPCDVERKISEKTKAIIPVHLYGLPADMDEILKISREHGIYVVEDACQAHGSKYRGRMAGSIGDMGCFSFYPSKIITTGEGGMITTNNGVLAEKLKMIRTHGQSKVYETVILGHNLRMPEICAAIGIAQMRKINKILELRRRNAKILTEILEKSDKIILPHVPEDREHNWYLYTVRFENEKIRNKVQEYLRSKGIDARVFYPKPIHQNPLYIKLGYGNIKLPNTEEACRTVLSLPVHQNLTVDEVEYIGRCVLEALKNA